MASLDCLPNELKDYISAHLSSNDLLRLSTTCRALYAYAQPLAYRNVTLTWSRHQQKSRSPQLYALLRTLLENPNHASGVRQLAFEAERCLYFVVDGYGEYDSETDQHYMDRGSLKVNIPGCHKKPEEEEMALLHRAIASQELEGHGNWKDEAIRSQELFACMAMIVTHCDKLESLDVSVAFTIASNWFEELIQIGGPGPDGSSIWLENLRHLRLSCNTGGYDWTPRCMEIQQAALYAFYLPKLQTLELAQFHNPFDEQMEDTDFEACFWPAMHQDIPLALTTLRFIRTSVSPRTLRTLLERTPNLRTLEFDAFENHEINLFDFFDFKSAIDIVKETLTSLTLRFEYYADEDNDPRWVNEATTGCLGPFRDYLALENLEISLHTLFGRDAEPDGRLPPLAHMLPPNLQTLTITDDFWLYDDFQQAFMDFDAMAIFRRFLAGQVLAEGETYHRRFSVTGVQRWTQVLPQPEWRIATPKLKKCVYDLRKRGYLSREYWNKGKARKQFRTMCKEQGLRGEVLWEKIQYY